MQLSLYKPGQPGSAPRYSLRRRRPPVSADGYLRHRLALPGPRPEGRGDLLSWNSSEASARTFPDPGEGTPRRQRRAAVWGGIPAFFRPLRLSSGFPSIILGGPCRVGV